MLAAVITVLQWKQSSEYSASRFILYISDFVTCTVLVFTYETCTLQCNYRWACILIKGTTSSLAIVNDARPIREYTVYVICMCACI